MIRFTAVGNFSNFVRTVLEGLTRALPVELNLFVYCTTNELQVEAWTASRPGVRSVCSQIKITLSVYYRCIGRICGQEAQVDLVMARWTLDTRSDLDGSAR
jgi:hypothetical protein